MLIITVFNLIYLIVSVINADDIMLKNANNYGPFTPVFEKFEICKGSKSKNLTTTTAELNAAQIVATINVTFLTDAKIDEMKIHVYNIKDNKKNFMWNHKLNDPCKHYAFAVLIKQYLKANYCFVKKGNYSNQINFRDVVHSFMGDNFYYGTFFYKSEISSNRGNIACFNTKLLIKKKTV